ncbi:MAG: hypothetical protein JSW62_01560 [Thermoplasmatales archaeon]|nr:MAG: hypothetical protein JSW62_01560 [Thermoplasmatales archaeon]
MKERTKKLLYSCAVIAIILFSVFAVITQNQIKDLKSTIIDKEEDPLIVVIYIDETSGVVPFEVDFTPLVLNAVGDVKYLWDFDDGKTSDKINPTYVFQNGSYNCTLTVTDDSGKKASDSIEISAYDNKPPTAIISLSHSRSNRPYKFFLPRISTGNKGIGAALEVLINRSLLPSSLMNLEGWITCEAQVNDPEGDEIVSYEWKLEPPSYETLRGRQVKPVHRFEGKSVTIPFIYAYRLGQYDVTLTVKDSAGNEASFPARFNVEISQTESMMWALRNFLKWILIDVAMNMFYEDFLNEEQQQNISNILWKIFLDPVKTILDTIVDNILALLPLPENIKNFLQGAYDQVWNFIENKFPPPPD